MYIFTPKIFIEIFFNILFNWELINLNESKQNSEAIDLISDTKKIVIQVSATCTKEKIESALNKNIIKKYKDYNFKFILISKDASSLRKKEYNNPYGIQFNPQTDIYDIDSILEKVFSLAIDDQKKIYNFIKKELGNEIDIVKLDSDLSLVINILAKENFSNIKRSINIDPFEIERKITFNELKEIKRKINRYTAYSPRLNSKYAELDAGGVNQSLFILSKINRIYQNVCVETKDKDADKIFIQVIDNITQEIINSKNFGKISTDGLEFCVDIIVVDAFIRCEIFENPKNYKPEINP
ncbi:MAG: ABC-three component system protein [bacterium]